MLHAFETVFRPAAAKQPGYVDVQMLRLHSAFQGSAPAGMNYRFTLTLPARNSGRGGWRRRRIKRSGQQSRRRFLRRTIGSCCSKSLNYDSRDLVNASQK